MPFIPQYADIYAGRSRYRAPVICELCPAHCSLARTTCWQQHNHYDPLAVQGIGKELVTLGQEIVVRSTRESAYV